MPKLELRIDNGKTVYQPEVEDSVVWETERQGVPGKLAFSVRKDAALNFQEGNQVTLTVDGKKVFLGFVFTKKRNKDGMIGVTAYDQLRYLKNKSILKYDHLTASDLIRKLAHDFRLNYGELEETGYVIPERLEDNQTLFDMIKYALDETLKNKKEMYVLYDDFGKLTLKNIGSMRQDVLIYQETAENFDYSSSIDSNTYNQILLGYQNETTKKIETEPLADADAIKRWGVLQYYEKVNNAANIKARAEAMLSLYNRKTRNLSVSKALGDIRVRGGSSVPVTLDLGDVVANSYMVVEKVKHTLSADTHFMDLTLIGGDFSA